LDSGFKPSPTLGGGAGVAGGGSQDGIAEAKELHEASKYFSVTTDLLLDVADSGSIDNPVNRSWAERFYNALGAALE
jgi:hypothetical protein